MRQHLTPANLVTSASITSGVLALLLLRGHLLLALVLLLLAAVFDVMDGTLARRAGGDRTFGAQLDSLSDLLCFCVVPAMAVHVRVGGERPVLAAATACVFVLAGAWRLSRFPLVQRQGSFVGLPTPAAGCLLMTLVAVAPVALLLLGALLLSAAMVSSVRVPTVLAAAGTVRPRRRSPGDRRLLRPRARLVRQIWVRPSRPSGRGPGRKVLGALQRSRVRRWVRPRGAR